MSAITERRLLRVRKILPYHSWGDLRSLGRDRNELSWKWNRSRRRYLHL